MSLHDQKDFLKQIPPFNKLNKQEIELCSKSMNIGYYPKDTTIISSTHIQDFFFLIIKGEVTEYNHDELIAVYHEEDSFDADSLMYEKTTSTFVVSDDLICYEMDKKAFLKLLETNADFKTFYLSNLSSRLQTLKEHEIQNEMSEFMISKVSEIYLNRICLVQSDCSLKDAIEKSIEYKTSTIVVENKEKNEYGIITDSLLKKNVFLKGCNLRLNVMEIATFPFICVDNEDFLFKVLLILTKRNIKRVGVKKDGKLIGTIDQIDILSFFANHVHLIATQINKAQTIEELKTASSGITTTVKSLFTKSVGTPYIAKMVSELNSKAYAKIFELIVPDSMQNDCALIIMGSEGRNEQILKTDQDNGLIVKNGIDVEMYRPYMEEITNALIYFGFPKCPGNIMVSNPYWSKSEDDYQNQIDIWLAGTSMEDYMNLAIFFDAKTVAGDRKILPNLKQQLFSKLGNNDVFMAYFANATLAFDTPIGIFANLKTKDDKIDLKKGAIFAIVQGVRSLSLEYKITKQSTIGRIKILKSLDVLTQEMAAELIEAFGLLLKLKLQAQIENINNNRSIDNSINIESLSKIQRDMLKDSFQIVNKFKKFISHHFKLNNLS